MAEKGYDPVFGARPLKRFLQRNIETKLARALIAGGIGEDTTVTFHVRGDELFSTARRSTWEPPAEEPMHSGWRSGTVLAIWPACPAARPLFPFIHFRS